MPFDPYALCPGGRDKKIRFCCPNMLKELEQVVKLLESDQPGACLAYIETLEKTHSDCACLTKAKLSIYRAENRWQEALPIAEQFYAKEPDNPTAAAEYALALVINGQPVLAVSTLVDAFEKMQADTVHSTLLHAALQIATYLLLSGLVIPAIAIGHVLKEIPATSEQANMLLFRATSEADPPLLLRDWSFDFDCPDDFPGKETFDEAAVLVRLMRWKQALALLEPLTQHADAWSGIWRNIATIHLWFLDHDKSREALKTYASLPNTPMEDAVDAETLRLLFSPVPFGDSTDTLTIEYNITDAEQALEKLLSDPCFRHMADLPERMFTPPPRGGFVLHDRPFPAPEVILTSENVPSYRVLVFLFGKETDREARLIAQALISDEQNVVEEKFREVLGDIIQIPGEVVNQSPVSKTRILMECRFVSPSLEEVGKKSIQHMVNDYYATSFPDQWLALPLGLLDGKTPSEAAQESKYTASLQAALNIIGSWVRETAHVDVLTTLRSRLGLPKPEMITVAETTNEDPLTVLDAYPVWRWHRFDVSKLSTEVLAGGMQIVLGMREMRTASRFAEELLNRPMDSMDFGIRVMAFEALILSSQENADIERALLWIERAKAESSAQNISDAAWYFHEITLQLARGDGPAASVAIAYLLQNHRDDPAVMQSLQELFVRLGMFNPDGTPSAAWTQALAGAGSQPAEQQAIWTPDAAAPAGGAAPSKLWVPD